MSTNLLKFEEHYNYDIVVKKEPQEEDGTAGGGDFGQLEDTSPAASPLADNVNSSASSVAGEDSDPDYSEPDSDSDFELPSSEKVTPKELRSLKITPKKCRGRPKSTEETKKYPQRRYNCNLCPLTRSLNVTNFIRHYFTHQRNQFYPN